MVGAIVLTGAIAPILKLGPPPSLLSLGGAALVVGALLLYASPARAKASPARKN